MALTLRLPECRLHLPQIPPISDCHPAGPSPPPVPRDHGTDYGQSAASPWQPFVAGQSARCPSPRYLYIQCMEDRVDQTDGARCFRDVFEPVISLETDYIFGRNIFLSENTKIYWIVRGITPLPYLWQKKMLIIHYLYIVYYSKQKIMQTKEKSIGFVVGANQTGRSRLPSIVCIRH